MKFGKAGKTQSRKGKAARAGKRYLYGFGIFQRCTMKTVIIGCAVWLGFINHSCGQSAASATEASSVVSAVQRLLPAGTYTVSAMEIPLSPRLAELTEKFKQGIQKDPSWILEQTKRKKPGPLNYDKRSGMTEAEFAEYQTLMDRRDLRVAPQFLERVSVIQDQKSIHFKAAGKLAILDSLWFDKQKNEMHIADCVLPYQKEITVAGERNAYGSTWRAYSWEMHRPETADFENLDFDKIKAMKYLLFFNIQLGKLDKTGQVFMKLKGQLIKDGVSQYSFDTPFFINE